LASAADAGGIGAVSGFNEGNGISERVTNAAKGAGTGALLGGALAGCVGAIAQGRHAAPIFRQYQGPCVNPEGFANSQIARAVSESGQTPAAARSRALRTPTPPASRSRLPMRSATLVNACCRL
jgi:hypothetical protein